MSETLLVTGGAGFIGTHLCRKLRLDGKTVVSLDLKGRPDEPVEGVEYVRGDARDPALVFRLLAAANATSVVHLAATVSVPLCQNDVLESYSHNLHATLAVLEAIRQIDRPVRFAFASSAALYGDLGNDRTPLPEERVARRFSSFYAAQKHASEKAVELYHSYHRIPALIFRFFNVYGRGQDPSSPYSGVITVFAKLARENRSLVLHNAGVQTRDFIPVTEVAGAIVSALALPAERWDSGVINLGSGIPTSIRDLAEKIRTLAGSDAPILDGPPREGDVLHSLADVRVARERLGFAIQPDLTSGLGELLQV